MPKVHFVREDKKLDVPEGTDLRRFCKDNGVQIYPWHARIGNCLGNGLCGTCLIQVDDPDALSAPTALEEVKLGKDFAPNFRLACQVTVRGDVRCLTQPNLPQGWHVHPSYTHMAIPDPFEGLPPLGQELQAAAQAAGLQSMEQGAGTPAVEDGAEPAAD